MNERDRKNRYLHQSRGQWQVACERLRLANDKPPLPSGAVRPIGDLVGGVLEGMRLDTHAQVEQIARAWPALVGPDLAHNTRPAHLEAARLSVYVNHPAWLYELRGAFAAEILSRVQDRFGKRLIQTIRWTIDPQPPVPP
ncbi:MAG: DUF721 domain-containing protein [Verrucomicrobiota bacterium]|jgi:hypothetical protein|nr:DUF721 domain-containing protein [Verrucomicrobiota bacterium]